MGDRVRIPFFPVPTNGETVYSVVGRCAERLGIANRHLLQLLTGQKYTTTLFSALPGYLGNISRVMPAGHQWCDLSALIDVNTALRYFTYFHPKELRESSAVQIANASNTQPVALGLGLSTYRVPAFPRSPRFCILCLQEQCRDPGFSYFHLAHQLPAVTYCWRHGELLSDGCINCGPYPFKGKMLTMPGQCLCDSFSASRLDSAAEDSESANWLARESAYLLISDDSIDDRREKLRGCVIRAGLCRGSLIDHNLLAGAIETRFGKDFLHRINYPTRDENGRPSAWIRRSLPTTSSEKRLPTIVGLLLLGAVCDSVNAFEHDQISSRHLELPDTQPADTTTSNKLQPAKWAINLTQLLVQHQYRISACATALNRSSWDIAIEAKKQQIAIPLSARAVKRIGEDRLETIRFQLQQGMEKKQILNAHHISEWTLLLIELETPALTCVRLGVSADSRRQKHRERVMEFLKANPSATRNTISVELSGTYDFLINQDKAWFHENVPKASPTKPSARSKRYDWRSIDESLANALIALGKQIQTSDERPQRITASGLLNKHRALQKYAAQPSRLPLTTKAIKALVETPEQYMERKVRWGIQRLIASKREISMESLRRETAIPANRLKQVLEMVRRTLKELGADVSEKSVLYD